ncbi:MAG: glucosamine-6-phosphate deaminase [Candidatus Atribacteria bacterium]|nr:glucosamine-6-phosphate deaminase [Candidatus Atribacteria bacterium]
MEVIVTENYQQMSQRAARIVAKAILAKPSLVLGLATGDTPRGMYRCLVSFYQEGLLDFSQVTTFNLDEYVGLDPYDSHSYHFYMQEELMGKINIRPENVHILLGIASDLLEECCQFEQSIERSGGIDLQVLGLGENGHIGFNEPGADWGSVTHLVKLTEETRKANSRFFSSWEEVPEKALTMGIKTIMQADRILLLVSGKNKGAALREALFGPVTPRVPASVLQLHPQVMVLVDQGTTQFEGS